MELSRLACWEQVRLKRVDCLLQLLAVLVVPECTKKQSEQGTQVPTPYDAWEPLYFTCGPSILQGLGMAYNTHLGRPEAEQACIAGAPVAHSSVGLKFSTAQLVSPQRLQGLPTITHATFTVL